MPLTNEQFERVMPWICKIAGEKDIETPNGLRIDDAVSSFDEETGKYSVRVYDEDADEDEIIAHGVTLVFEDSRIEALIDAAKPLYWRQEKQEQEVALREGALILKAIKALRKGLHIGTPWTSPYRDELWQVNCRRNDEDSYSVKVKIRRAGTSRFSNSPTGKIWAHVTGWYGDLKKGFKQRSDGSVNHEAIAKFVLETIESHELAEERKEEQAAEYAACREAIQAAAEKHGVWDSGMTYQYERKVKVSFTVELEDLDHAIEVLVREGFIQKRNPPPLAVCMNCGKKDCFFDCDQSQGDGSLETDEEVEARRRAYNLRNSDG